MVTSFAGVSRGERVSSSLLNEKRQLTVAVLITGPSKGGIGAETASTLACESPELILLLGRSQEKIQPCIDDIHAASSSVKVQFIKVELDSLASVRAAAQQIVDDPEIKKIDVVINNAGIMACPYGTTVDGFERQFGTNHLSHFLLTNLLTPKLLAAGPRSRVVNVSSWGHKFFAVDFEDPGFSEGKTYDPVVAYGQAKIANILFSVSLNEKLGRKGLHSYALHPGSKWRLFVTGRSSSLLMLLRYWQRSPEIYDSRDPQISTGISRQPRRGQARTKDDAARLRHHPLRCLGPSFGR